jgi:hypothetical protein
MNTRDRFRRSSARNVSSLAAIAFLLADGSPAARQLPPSIVSSVPVKPELTEADRAQQCPKVRTLVALLKGDAAWLRQPYSASELSDLERLMRSMGCVIGELEGTWTVDGTGPNSADPNYRENLTLVAKAVNEQKAYDDMVQWFGGNAWWLMCRSADVFYVGTLNYSSEPPWRGWGYTKKEASFVACANSQSAFPLINGRFGLIEGDGRSTPKLNGTFMWTSDGATVSHANAINPRIGHVDWKMKRVNR